MPALKPKIRQDLTVVELDGEAVMYDDRDGRLHHLNATATLVFNLCDGQVTMKELSRDIAEVVGISAQKIERQVRTLLRQFRKEGLLEKPSGSVKQPAHTR
jgi:PqqD family protein of HPr-rel-A system